MGAKIKKDENGRVEIDYNGAVVCFQKFTIGQNVKFQDAGNPKMHIPGSPACLGYFNRVDVKKIRDFRKYVSVTSEYEAEYPCSRKQLLLRRIKSLQHLDQVVLLDSKDTGNSLPFLDEKGNSYALCCLSVFSISEGDGEHKNTYARENFYAGLAEELYTILNNAREENHYECRFAFMELLGAEDLCLIVLSNQYRAISDAIEMLQQFNYKSAAQNRIYQNCRVDNVHSILMMDRENEEILKRVEWDNANAEMHFSLHAAPGMRYLRNQQLLLQKYLDEMNQERDKAVPEKGAKQQIRVESCSGEYDAILRCPAWLLPIVLGLPSEDKNSIQGCFHPDNDDYRCKVYQSDTYIYPFGLNSDDEKKEDIDREGTAPETVDETTNAANGHGNNQMANIKVDDKYPESSEADELKKFIKQAIKTLRDVFGGVEEDNSFEFQELPIWRLLKEFWSFASFPLSADLREDLECQFKMAINSIVKEAVLSKEGGNRADFMDKYQQIVKALDDSMQAASQQDRWYFGEQQSYIENVESYYKILRCYYGMLKDMITMIYQIPRTSDTNQPYLIPMLSFGVNPLIKSNAYDSYVDTYVNPRRNEKKGREKALTPDEVLKMPEAKVISIKLPYQALSNPMKYLGILAHEIFHYASPADREDRNELMCCALIRIAISEFIDILARCSEIQIEEDLWPILLDEKKGDKTFQELIDIAVNNTFANIQNKTAGKIRLKDIRELVEEGELRFTVDSTAVRGYECYYRIWASLRAMLINVQETDPAKIDPDLAELPSLCEEYIPYYNKIFALDDWIPDDMEPWEKNAVLRGLYERSIRNTMHNQIVEARNLLRTAYEAMVECPSDIFDLEVVMHGKSPEEKVRQFFWQQYSAKRDLLSPWAVYRQDKTEPLLKNDIRSAMIVSYYLNQCYGQDDPEVLERVLEKWGESNFKPLFENARKEFVRGYSRVYTRFRYLFEENSQICEKLAKRIFKQVDRSGLKQKLTKFYEGYYAELENFQRGKNDIENQNLRYDAIFAKTCALIDEYQTRPRFIVKGDTSAPPLPENETSKDTENRTVPKQLEDMRRDLRFECDQTAYNNSDLLYKLSLAYEKMMVNEKMPMLWYRGQQEWEWRTLPNVMRIERMTTETPDHEGFAQTMFYEMQLARAHILPNGEHLSDAEWIAFLQHYGFKTNALDFSESLAPALFFATEKWEDDKTKRPKTDAVIMAFNPVLFNLVMELFELEEYVEKLHTARNMLNSYGWEKERLRESRQDVREELMKAKAAHYPEEELVKLEKTYDQFDAALKVYSKVENEKKMEDLIDLKEELVSRAKAKLKRYLESGINYEQPPLFTGTTEPNSDPYGHLYDLLHADNYDSCLHPRAVMVPRHCDRMAKQSGEFVYLGINAKRAPGYATENEVTSRVYNYDRWSLESLHQKYVDRCRQELKDYEKRNGECPDAKFIPFLCRIKINSYRHAGFKRYVHAMGMHKFSVYPEYDKLAEDLAEQLNLK